MFGTIASQFNDPGTNVLYLALLKAINARKGAPGILHCGSPNGKVSKDTSYRLSVFTTWAKLSMPYGVTANRSWSRPGLRGVSFSLTAREVLCEDGTIKELDRQIALFEGKLQQEPTKILKEWPERKASYRRDQLVTKVRGKEIRSDLYTTTLSGTRIPKVCIPDFADWGEIVRWSMLENVPGCFPFTAGVFRFKRAEEDPKRQFAGEGTPERTNRRFHYLSKHEDAKRLSTAFDSVTLYGEDPDYPPDVYGKVGESGVSICTLNDMKKLFAGFDLCAANTSVSLTINGPAPIMLAFFFNAAIDQQVDLFREKNGREPSETRSTKISAPTPCDRARNGAGRYPQGGPGTEHLHLLDGIRAEDDGGYPAVLHRKKRSATTTRSASAATISPRPGPTRSATGLHPGQRIHFRRVLPLPRHEHRRLRAQPSVSFRNGLDPEYALSAGWRGASGRSP